MESSGRPASPFAAPAPNPPLASEPRHILVVLNLAQRKALYRLIHDIVLCMRERLDCLQDDAENGPLFAEEERTLSFPTTARAMTDARQEAPSSPPALRRIQVAARNELTGWGNSLLSNLKTLLSTPEHASVLEARKKRLARLAELAQPPSMNVLAQDPLASNSSSESAEQKDAAATARAQKLYRSMRTTLSATLSRRDKEEILSALLLQCLVEGDYSAHDRAMLCHVCSSLGLPLSVLDQEEVAVAETLISSSQTKASSPAVATAAVAAQAKQKEDVGEASRMWRVGLASVAGAAVIGITGGLAAPLVAGAVGSIMGGIGLGGVASLLGVFWGNSALVGTLFGAYGAMLGGETMNAYAREVEDFAFLPVNVNGNVKSLGASGGNTNNDDKINKNNDNFGTISKRLDCAKKSSATNPRLRLTVGINGLITNPSDVTTPWSNLPTTTEIHALRYEQQTLLNLGQTLNSLIKTAAWKAVRAEVLKRTVLSTLFASLWPAWLLGSAAAQLDNPFSRARNRSDKAGRVLAEALAARVHGRRPVTLVGFSLGARVVQSCLRHLGEEKAFGVVEDVVLIGAPVPSNAAHWSVMRCVASGRIVNVHSSRDMVLAFLYRASSIQLGIAGLTGVEGNVPGVENINLTGEVEGHMRYLTSMGKVLTRCGIEGIAGGEGRIEGSDGDGSPSVVTECDLLDFEDYDADNQEWQSSAMDRVTEDLEGLTSDDSSRKCEDLKP